MPTLHSSELHYSAVMDINKRIKEIEDKLENLTWIAPKELRQMQEERHRLIKELDFIRSRKT